MIFLTDWEDSYSDRFVMKNKEGIDWNVNDGSSLFE